MDSARPGKLQVTKVGTVTTNGADRKGAEAWNAAAVRGVEHIQVDREVNERKIGTCLAQRNDGRITKSCNARQPQLTQLG